tara:strand:- start:160 stop:330 length:171 start_codon:yes stop_codon:yes gene_type:complete
MVIDKKNKIDKAIKVANFIKDSLGKLKRKTNYSGLHAHVRSIVDNGIVRTEGYDDD